MRTTLVPSLLETVSRNLSYRSLDLRLFELRPVFLPQSDDSLPEEVLRLTAVMTGRRQPEGWAQTNDAVDFFDLKGATETLFDIIGVEEPSWSMPSPEPYLHGGQSAVIRSGETLLGSLGAIHPQVAGLFDISQPVFLLDLDLRSCFDTVRQKKELRPLSRFPYVSRDSAFLLDRGIAFDEVARVLNQVKKSDVEEMVLFDLYSGTGVPSGKKSMAIRIRYRSLEKTLTDEEINHSHGRFIEALRRNLGAEIR